MSIAIFTYIWRAPLKVLRPRRYLMESVAGHSASPAECAAASRRYSLQQALEITEECDRRSHGADHERLRIPGPRRSHRLQAAAIVIPVDGCVQSRLCETCRSVYILFESSVAISPFLLLVFCKCTISLNL